MPQWVSKKTDRLLDIVDAGSAAGMNVPDMGDANDVEVVLGNDSRLSDERIWFGVDISGQSAANHTLSTLDVGDGLRLRSGWGIAYKQVGDTAWRYAYIDSYNAGVLALIGEPATAAVSLIALQCTRLIEWPLYHFDAGINAVSHDLYADERGQADEWSGGPSVLLGVIARLAVSDGTTGSEVNVRINGGDHVFSAALTLDNIYTNTSVTAQSNKNRLTKGSTIEITNTSPGSGDQSMLDLKLLICPLIEE